MKEHRDWNESYREGNLPWDTGRPSTELQRLFDRMKISPGRALDIGCGTGTNSVWLAEQGFEVTGVDVAPLAIKRAEERAKAAGVRVDFIVGDVLHLPNRIDSVEFFFDRGCYHAVRRTAPEAYAPAVAKHLAHAARGLILAGNAREPHTPGPPVVTEEEICRELGLSFQILDLHEFRFDDAPGVTESFLGWSCFVEKK